MKSAGKKTATENGRQKKSFYWNRPAKKLLLKTAGKKNRFTENGRLKKWLLKTAGKKFTARRRWTTNYLKRPAKNYFFKAAGKRNVKLNSKYDFYFALLATWNENL